MIEGKDVRSFLLKGLALPQKACCSNLHKTMRGEDQQVDKHRQEFEDRGCCVCNEEMLECKRCERVFCKWCDLAVLDFPSKYNGLVCPVCEIKMQCERLVKDAGGGSAMVYPIVQDVSVVPSMVQDVSIVEGSDGCDKHSISPDQSPMKDRKQSKVGEAPILEDFVPPQGPVKVSPYKEPHDAKKEATKELKRELKRKASIEIRKALKEYKGDERRHTITGVGARKPSMLERKQSLLERKQSMTEGTGRKQSVGLVRTQSLDQERKASAEARKHGRAQSLVAVTGERKHSTIGAGERKNSTVQLTRSNSLVAKLCKPKEEKHHERAEPDVPPTPPARKAFPKDEEAPQQPESGRPPLVPLDNNNSKAHQNQRAGDKFQTNLAKAGGSGAGVEARISALRRVSQIEEPPVASPTNADGMATARSRIDAVTACETADVSGGFSARYGRPIRA